MRNLLIYFILIFFVSCSDTEFIGFETKDVETYLCLSGFVCNDSIYVCLTPNTKANYVLNDTTHSTIITDISAEVTIFADDQYFCTLQPKTRIDTDSYTGRISSFNYYVAYNPVTSKKTYRVEALHPILGLVTAETKLNSPLLITTDTTTVFENGTLSDGFIWNGSNYVPKFIDTTTYITYFSFIIHDVVNEDNWYQHQLQCDNKVWFHNVFSSTQIKTPANVFEDYNHDIASDSYNDGLDIPIEFSVLTGIYDSISFDIKAFNYDYYKYIESTIAYKEAEDDPFSKPIGLYSNVSNGFGVFGAFQSYHFQNY
ncbi:MAG: hypothetical protein CVU09_17975 [Bacteroidetes bacterium HGW-Bacteroidetes-4]|jgi:hypothetical protein|nr:MAG: hypothetical protein CVU09_17975 [Bacteroidetes bacterium HGW-Bacteroidetes-4]